MPSTATTTGKGSEDSRGPVEFGGMQEQDVLGVRCGLRLSPVQGAARGADEQGEKKYRNINTTRTNPNGTPFG